MSIPQETLEQIQERVDIVELVSAQLPLKRAGRNFRALCPFHHEKTPSFMVSPEKQIFHCFGCGEGGDVFQFVMKTERVTFLDAVRSLAEKAGIPLPKQDPASEKRSSESAQLYEANALAQAFYRNTLLGPQGENARRYLVSRGLDSKTEALFQIGYAPAGFQEFLKVAKAKGFSEQTLLRAGLILKGEDGSFRDRFRNRILFPIANVKGRILGFGGRVLDQGEPKYLNSPETEIFFKGRELYGLVHSGKWIREKESVILVEGYLDLIALYQSGIPQVVATLGTSLTRDQVRLLKRYAREVVVVFDPDKAGEAASLRGLDLFLEGDLSVRMVTLPGEDPDAFVRKRGAEAFLKMVEEAKPLIPYRLESLARKFSLKTPEGKSRACQEILPSIARIENAILRSAYLKELAESLAVREEDLLLELKRLKGVVREREIPLRREQATLPPAEAMLLRILLDDAKWISFTKERLTPERLSDGRSQKMLQTLYERFENGELRGLSRLATEFHEIAGKGFFSEFALSVELLEEEKEKALNDCIQKIRMESRNRLLASLEAKIKRAESVRDQTQLEALMAEFQAVRKQGVS